MYVRVSLTHGVLYVRVSLTHGVLYVRVSLTHGVLWTYSEVQTKCFLNVMSLVVQKLL